MRTACALVLTLFVSAAMVGCNESSPPPSASYIRDGKDTQWIPPGPEFKLSREAAKQQQEGERQKTEEVASAEDARPSAENPPAKPRRRTVFDSLYEAVRNGAAEALDENASSP